MTQPIAAQIASANARFRNTLRAAVQSYEDDTGLVVSGIDVEFQYKVDTASMAPPALQIKQVLIHTNVGEL